MLLRSTPAGPTDAVTSGCQLCLQLEMLNRSAPGSTWRGRHARQRSGDCRLIGISFRAVTSYSLRSAQFTDCMWPYQAPMLTGPSGIRTTPCCCLSLLKAVAAVRLGGSSLLSRQWRLSRSKGGTVPRLQFPSVLGFRKDLVAALDASTVSPAWQADGFHRRKYSVSLSIIPTTASSKR